MVEAIVETVREYLTNGLNKHKIKKRQTPIVEPICPGIITGKAIEDRASVFQGHVAKIASIRDTEAVIAKIRVMRKIHRAKHNVSAYRITRPNGEVVEGSDDDGEAGAGIVLLNLLQKANMTNCLVVVTRWFGLVQIGSDRFKHYRGAALLALNSANPKATFGSDDGTQCQVKKSSLSNKGDKKKNKKKKH